MIQVDGVFKRFRQLTQRPLSLKRLALLQGMPGHGPWVVEDLSLQVAAGEAVGIVGKNGCGKTTLLRLIAGILQPDQGRIDSPGRIAPLLGLGAGFHPDLTGRENIFLNASILGFSRAQTLRRLGEIAEFSGLGERLEMPLRYYSAGMHSRLGFAVAAHLEPEIMLLDEVLAVGDASFRNRCADRIDQLYRAGTTLLMVTHDMVEIERFCKRCVWIDQGRIAADGAPAEVVPRYLASYN